MNMDTRSKPRNRNRVFASIATSIARTLGPFVVVIGAITAVMLGLVLAGGGGTEDDHDHESTLVVHAASAGGTEAVEAPRVFTGDSTPLFYTCVMHPSVRLPTSDKCPICKMELVPVTAGDQTSASRILTLTPEAAALADVRVQPVQRHAVDVQRRLVGKVEYDETRLTDITSRVSGRLDRLYVDFTGVTVRRGDHLAEIYSPELLVAQQELIQARAAFDQLAGGAASNQRRQTELLLGGAREKLRLLDLTSEQIGEIETAEAPQDHLTLYAPGDGIVVSKHANEGAYVQTGTPIYTLADLSHVWVQLDAYESDLHALRYAQPVEFTTPAHPGATFQGRIAFISPTLNDRTRTVKVRVNAENRGGLLKPGMFIRAIVHANIASNGSVVDRSLAGKWIGPMHPEIIKDEAGTCDICGMELVSAEKLGYVAMDDSPAMAPLVVPATAVLQTGRRAVVYVRVPTPEDEHDHPPTFEGREVVLGPRAGDHYIVLAGLEEDEFVVTSGNFKIDSALQIQARPSMMAPVPEIRNAPPTSEHQHVH